ncbi:MAG TPA: PaaI family thioesterase [Methanoregulaceae archaeon]|nr:PaaI family thioesterase [Methanoregulaceae archaeon]
MTSYLDRLRAEGEGANPFFAMTGTKVVRMDGGVGELSVEVGSGFCNGEGWVQGGLYAALADEAIVLAIYQTLGEDETIATITESTSFLRGVNAGSLRAVGRVVKRGRRVIFGEGQVFDGDGKLCTITTASYAVSTR